MGCLLVKLGFRKHPHHELQEEAPKKYSWDTRPKINPEDITIEGVKGETVGRLPGTINGLEFIIQKCEDSNIYIFDHMNTVTIDFCNNCNIFLGPVSTSLFIRNCNNCNLVVACQQFRTRDCQKISAFLCCTSQPIIESSSGMKFGCYCYSYPQLEGQFKSSGLSVFNNHWGTTHDFTQDPTEVHYSLLPEDAKVEDYVPIPTTEQFQQMQIALDPDSSVVPRTHGSRRKTSDESCLIVFFSDGRSSARALSFIELMKTSHRECVLIQTQEFKMQPSDAQRVFGTDTYTELVQKGSVIGLEYNGDGCIQHCQDTIPNVYPKASPGLIFISNSPSAAAAQIDNFYNYADMQMNA